MDVRRRWRLVMSGAAMAAVVVCAGGSVSADVLLAARVQIAMTDPRTCDVTTSIALGLDRAADIEQRVQRLEGARVDLLGISGARQTGPPRAIGLTDAYLFGFPGAGHARYEVRYRATQTDAWAYRCPVWLPAVAADGHSRNVDIEVTLPPDAEPAGGSFPAFQWRGTTGRATLGNLPAFVRLPYAVPGQSGAPTRDVGRIMELAAIALLATGMTFWVVRRRR